MLNTMADTPITAMDAPVTERDTPVIVIAPPSKITITIIDPLASEPQPATEFADSAGEEASHRTDNHY